MCRNIEYIHVKDTKKENGCVVPAGYGDGNVASILKDLIGNGYEGFLSIEPHLSDFKGFVELEKDGISIARKDENKLSGFEAFKLAHDALVKITSYC